MGKSIERDWFGAGLVMAEVLAMPAAHAVRVAEAGRLKRNIVIFVLIVQALGKYLELGSARDVEVRERESVGNVRVLERLSVVNVVERAKYLAKTARGAGRLNAKPVIMTKNVNRVMGKAKNELVYGAVDLVTLNVLSVENVIR